MGDNKFVDPVCGMDVDSSEYRTEYEGKTYYFCSQDCLTEFQSAPEDFVGDEEVSA